MKKSVDTEDKRVRVRVRVTKQNKKYEICLKINQITIYI